MSNNNKAEDIRERFKRNTEVVVVTDRAKMKGRAGVCVSDVYDFHNAIKVQTSSGLEIVTADDLVTKDEADAFRISEKAAEAEERRQAALTRLMPVVELRKAGKSEIEIAAELGYKTPLTAWARIKEAQRKGLL